MPRITLKGLGKGTYALLLHLDSQRRIAVGRLKEFDFPAGHYVYVGSALGPGGLGARIGRHLRPCTKAHWPTRTRRCSPVSPPMRARR